MPLIFGQINRVDYTNYKGIREMRTIIPLSLEFKSTPDHPEAQWIVNSHDLDRNAPRSYALKDIHAVVGREA